MTEITVRVSIRVIFIRIIHTVVKSKNTNQFREIVDDDGVATAI